MPTKTTAIRNARWLREAHHWSLRDVAGLIGVNHAAIARFETSQTSLTLENLLAYARLLGVTIDELIRSEGEAAA